jgi:hypothetical protein
MSAGEIGCPREEIIIYDDHLRWGGGSWTAECQGRTYFCSAVAGDTSCTQQAQGGEIVARTDAHVATQTAGAAPTPAAAATTANIKDGCAYDTQCKGDRLCVAGACTDATRTARHTSPPTGARP